MIKGREIKAKEGVKEMRVIKEWVDIIKRIAIKGKLNGLKRRRGNERN